jgi:preprotein translocase subunit SecE
MENNQKWINLSYLSVALLLAIVVYLLAGKVVLALDIEGRVRSLDLILKGVAVLVGLVTFFILFKNEKVNVFMTEVVSELSKVTWPTQDETFKATIAVIIAVAIAGAMLWIMDMIWVYIIGLIV